MLAFAAKAKAAKAQAVRTVELGESGPTPSPESRPVALHDFSRIPVHAPVPGQVQLKKEVSAPDDGCEHEADRVAATVMRLNDQKDLVSKPVEDEDDVPIKELGVAEKVMAKVDTWRDQGPGADDRTVEPDIETRIQTMRGGGRPLVASERQFMETRFAADFDAVRIHTNDEADTCSRVLQARAFTLGSDIFFRGGEYVPGAPGSRRLLAHELTHSIQQGAVMAGALRGGQIGARSTAVLQRQPVIAPPIAPPPVGRATLNFLPILMDQAPTGWGVTVLDDPVFDITAFASGATWKCVITQADQQTHQGVRLMPGVVEVTPALVAAEANCATLKTMSTSLSSVASQGAHSGFYILAAVKAHEDEHVRQYKAGLPPHYGTLKAAVEALTVPLAGHTAASAKTAIKALPAYTAAMATFHAADVAANNATSSHVPIAPFNTAEHGVVDPMVATIGARRTALACPP
jgi:hypothetical protein